MDRKEYRRNSETIASLLLPLKMHCDENTNKCIDETLRAWSKLEKVEQIVNKSYTEDDFYNVVQDIKEVLDKE